MTTNVNMWFFLTISCNHQLNAKSQPKEHNLNQEKDYQYSTQEATKFKIVVGVYYARNVSHV